MGTKTIGIKEEVYERLRARKREDESFTDLMDRLLDETTVDWQDTFDTLPRDDADELETIVAHTREQASEGLATRQQDALETLANSDPDDETA